MKRVLVTGASGQLGQCIDAIKDNYQNLTFIYASRERLDISNKNEVDLFFKSNTVDWCVNCAAYTAVDRAESDIENAKQVNINAVRNLAEATLENNVRMIHVSTDFVFDGKHNKAYKEDAETNPLGVYGQTKLDGEKELATINPKHFIIRTSWLYSEFNSNFMRTMLRLSQDRDELNVVCDQIGTPTYAKDLADALLQIISQDSSAYGIYHYSNEGVASWYDFAKAIFEINANHMKVNPIDSSSFPTPAQRPHFSVLDKTKIKKTFNLEIPYWKDSLKIAISNL
ncbi:dTDP-4-dehydrorhamnose reductase [uncultured Psychroserpens sp.]|uniref:dTDP-4-dehydrorhamnose reductase n=1 Tax=uncultured Psychroserpens sp. TaxID=255436 RepID=UPI002630288D|nr:dTDP-4-dehydrorhamnose reductase [uncultured Psychroserpens sp.]